MVLETKEGLPKLVLVSFPTRTRHWGRAGLDTSPDTLVPYTVSVLLTGTRFHLRLSPLG